MEDQLRAGRVEENLPGSGPGDSKGEGVRRVAELEVGRRGRPAWRLRARQHRLGHLVDAVPGILYLHVETGLYRRVSVGGVGDVGNGGCSLVSYVTVKVRSTTSSP